MLIDDGEGRKMDRYATGRNALCLLIALILLALPRAQAFAQVRGKSPNVLPNATIISDDTPTGRNSDSVDEGVPPVSSLAPAAHSHLRHQATTAEPTYSAAVEPTHAMLKVKKDAWAYAGPENSSQTLERVHAGKFVNVTGSTHYFLQVKLKDGSTGYVPIAAVDLTRPQDKIMRLSTDAGVLSQPNRYGKKLAEVHQGHDVHVVGVSMNYIRIRMKSGLEGYIPMTAAE
jgi:hypothetical protein